ncbi:DNA-binding transcriptional LysR family regulator [Streptomyces sp. 1114.5]|uniref:LysR family transcriptional regulator n=1 Tax=unclassified Streptomyces TaxID=2593676 RepID=UPI000BDC3B5E|nr:MULTISPECIES: LysR family transcriptional regulator [unclassified Streptomyces]RKT11304.1 DNA-binding transcriptional LysR family regulator [Streptomyces sp. 1114.5]SOB81354.1 DNA-binding transcriptional regulator, LysR family [Streptomyces sp. 1331.2]
MELEFRHLRIICSIADSGSLTRAAASLRLTQPGLSAQLTRIERALGGELFSRAQSGVVPTAFGEVVLSRARALLPTIDELLEASALAARRSCSPHRFRLGSVNAPLLGGLITAIRSHHPEAEISSRGHGCPVPLVEDIAGGRLEAAVVGDSPGYELVLPPGVTVEPIATEPLFVALPAAHPLAALEEVALEDLEEEDWAAPRPDNDRIREYWSRTLLVLGHRIRVVHEAEGRLLLDIVRHGHAVSFCQATFEEVPGIAVRPIAGNPLWYRHLLAWYEEGPLETLGPSLVQDVIEAYRTACARSTVYQGWLERHDGAVPPQRTAVGVLSSGVPRSG